MASALPECSMLVAELEKAFNDTFHDHEGMRNAGVDPVVWSEGGEWPQFQEVFKPVTGLGQERDFSGKFVNPGSATAIESFVTRAEESGPSVNLSLDCGLGKSTTMVIELFRLKVARSIIVVQPTVVVAQRLAEYVGFIEDGGVVSDVICEGRTRGIIYISAGKMFEYIMTGGQLDSDLVVLDEAHCVTPVYRCLRDIIKRLQVRVIQLTASTGSGIRGPRGSRLTIAKRCDAAVSGHLARAGSKAVMVGVAETGSYALSANMLIGATVDLRVMYDTGLRPDPVLRAGKLYSGERQATTLEITQMVGRIARVKGTTGVALYNPDAHAMHESGKRLYDVVHNVLLAVAGLESAYSYEKAAAIYARGFVSYGHDHKRDSGFGSASGAEDSVGTSLDGDVGKVEEVLSDGCVGGDESNRDEGRRVRRRKKRPSLDKRRSSYDGREDSFYTSYGRVERQLLGRTPSIDATLTDGLTNGLGALTVVRDHPYQRGSVSFPEKNPTRGLITQCIQALDRLWTAGGRIYAGRFDVDPGIVGRADREDARRVLSKQMLPSFTEDEAHSVMLLWNQVAETSSTGIIASAVFMQFRDYFASYDKYMTRVGSSESTF